MSDDLHVLLEDRVAGTVTRLRGGRLRFRYDDAYRRDPASTPLSLSMPTAIGTHEDAVVAPWLQGLLPDDDAVLRRWARRFHTSTSAFALLATPVGEDCPGAVRFARPADLDDALERRSDVAWLTDDEVGERLRDLRADTTSWLGRTFTGQFSLAGAQAKTALLLQGGRWGVPSGGLATTHILKPAIRGLDDHDLNEHLCLDAARRAGLLVARTRVATFGGETAVVVARYDRRAAPDGTVQRVHQEDVCQALGVPPSRKYQNEGGPRPGQVAELLRGALPAPHAAAAVERFADALIWNWLVAGTDAHAKNYSLLLAGDQARFAPLYDIASALPYGDHERSLRFAMKLGGDYRVHVERNPWPKADVELGLDADALTARASQLASIVGDAFADAAGAPEVEALDRPLPRRLTDLVAARAERCRTVLAEG